MYKKSRLLVCLTLVMALAGAVQAAPLAPDDATINDSLCLWLRNPGVNLDEVSGIWVDSSDRGNDAEPAGDVSGATYVGPTLSFGSNPTVFNGEFSAAKFSGDVDDLLRAANINGGINLSDLTIIVVYKLYNQDQSGAGMTRPVGVGSFIGEGANLGNFFNLANDVSIRKDNGSVQGATATHPDDEFFVRVARMNASSINQWFNTTGTLELVHDASGASYTTSTDNFYLGDIRADSTNGGGTSGYSTSDIDIAEVIVYNTDLTDAQIEGINEWLQGNVGSGGGNPLAAAPNPADETLYENTWVSLSWRAGYYAVSHDLYFGTVFDDVNNGASETFAGNLGTTTQVVGFPGFPAPEGLQPGTTYYWRVDEVNDANVASPWKGDVWSFTVPPRTAYNPSLADGTINVLQDVTLTWTAGFGAKLHNVYFGDNFDDISNAAGALPQTDTTFSPSTLESEKTYYWRIDEFDGAFTHKGDVWSFSTVPDIAVTNANLMLWWTLDESAGATAVDWSGHGNHGAIIGDAQWADGYQGAALTFGDDVYVEAAGYDGVTGTAARTCCAWIRTTTANRNIMSWGQNTAGQKWRIRLQNTGGLRVEVNGGSHYGVTNLADGLWHHVAVTFEDDGTPDVLDTLLYVDGQLDATAASADEPIDTAAGGPVRIGLSAWHSAPFLDEIDDARIYDKALTAEEIQQAMLGNTKLAGSPVPVSAALVDIRDISSLNWSAGDNAVSHDVYFGTDRDAVAGADQDAPEFQGNQNGTSLSLASLVEFGGGDYYWRVDEIEAAGTVNAGTIWKFTVPDYLIVDNFESYDNIDPLPGEPGINRIFDKWIDGFGTVTNGALVGNDLPPYAEQGIVREGAQSMIYRYDNFNKASEATLALTRRDWTEQGVTKLSLWFRGDAANAADRVFVALNGTSVIYHDDAITTQITGWKEWVIDLATFGADLTNVTSITIGIGAKGVPTAGGGIGTMYFDEIRLIRPTE